jgi:ABC-type multidrug transport system ATPase subunit
VKETFTFAFDCKSGGTHVPPGVKVLPEGKAVVDKEDREKTRVVLSLQGLGLTHVGDTFVGNADVRGVSGGQRRRVSLGEMMQTMSPVLCGDEISTGLDAAATFDICRSLMFFGKANGMTRILSLLQPSPETVSLFDDVILMADGKVLYAGPISEVEAYFESLGYQPPDQMDIADFLQEISTPGGMSLYKAEFDTNNRGHPYSMAELADQFRASEYYKRIEDDIAEPWTLSWANAKDSLHGIITMKYRNSPLRAIVLNLSRALLIWSRDVRFLFANAIKNIIMGVSVGGVFYQTNNDVSFFGVCFQINLFIMLGKAQLFPLVLCFSKILMSFHHLNQVPWCLLQRKSTIVSSFTSIMTRTSTERFHMFSGKLSR